MTDDLDILADEAARSLGPDAVVSVPDANQAKGMAGPTPVEEMFRVITCGKRMVLVAHLPPAWPNNAPSDQENDLRTERSLPRQAENAIRTLNYLANLWLGPRDLAAPAFTTVSLAPGWSDPMFMAHSLEQDTRFCEKFVKSGSESPSALLDRIPSLGRCWAISPIAQDAVWLESFTAPTGIGPLSKVKIDFGVGPGISVLQGANSTGKTITLQAIDTALRSADQQTNTAPGELTMTGSVSRGPGHASEEGMQRFRRLMGYGDAQGQLFMPIEFDSHAFQKLEKLGQSLVACAEAPGSWPGLILDAPDQALDDIRTFRLTHAIAALARERQVVVSCRGANQQAVWKTAAECAGADYAGAGLNEGSLVLKHARTPVMGTAGPGKAP